MRSVAPSVGAALAAFVTSALNLGVVLHLYRMNTDQIASVNLTIAAGATLVHAFRAGREPWQQEKRNGHDVDGVHA